MKKVIVTLIYLFTFICFGQNDNLFNRLRAINNNAMTFYNIDGISISHQIFNYSFGEKNLKKIYRKYSIKKNDLKTTTDNLDIKNYKVTKTVAIDENLKQTNVYYFVENKENKIDVFWFGYNGDSIQSLEHEIISSISNDRVPDNCFSSSNTDKINFVGRELELGGNCYWTNINSIQCPYNGQMNWSIHKTKESADLSNKYQLALTKSKKSGKIISEASVEIEFEGVLTKAKKVIYDFNGLTSLVAGGENLTIFYVSEKIRNRNISCVLSFWNNDNITSNGLTPLLEQVMKYSKK